MTEQELMAQFEHEYCEEFPIVARYADWMFDLDRCGEYKDEVVLVGYKMWKRAKTEVRNVEINLADVEVYLNYELEQREITFDEWFLEKKLKQINVEVEFV